MQKNQNKFEFQVLKYSAVLVLVFLLWGGFAFARGPVQLCDDPVVRAHDPEHCYNPAVVAPLPGHYSRDVVVTSDIVNLLGQVARFLIIISTIIAVIFIVWGGITWMTAGSDTEKQKKAKALIKNGIIGALVVLAVGVIMQTIAHFVKNRGIT